MTIFRLLMMLMTTTTMMMMTTTTMMMRRSDRGGGGGGGKESGRRRRRGENMLTRRTLMLRDTFPQADATAWMALYSIVMLNIALELALYDPAYEDMACKFLEHFARIAEALNNPTDKEGLWDPQDEFYYDHLHQGHQSVPVRIRSLVGLAPLLACWGLDDVYLAKLPAFRARLDSMLTKKALASQVGLL